jgi:hypothetical protein
MTLLLDGQKIQGKNLKVTGNLRIESGDMSGQTSNTDKAHKGFKPKTLAVSLMIPFVDRVQLTDLMRMAEATASGGELHLYRVVNDTAEAFGVRQVEFSEGVSAREADSLKAWLSANRTRKRSRGGVPATRSTPRAPRAARSAKVVAVPVRATTRN